MNRSIFIRRGRNNRLFYKAIANDVFHMESEDEDDEDDKYKSFKVLKKRKQHHKYGSIAEYVCRERPGYLPYLNP